MTGTKNYYIYNSHNAPITANTRDENRKVRSTRTFMPERRDPMSGRIEHTGYTTLTEEEYNELRSTSKSFTHYIDDLKLLKVCDDLPPDAKTPHEALVDARSESQRLAAELAGKDAEITGLKARVLDAETKLGQLVAASTGEEKLRPLTDQIAALTARSTGVEKLTSELLAQIDRLAGKNKDVKAILEDYAAKVEALDKPEKDFE
jgi:chromosome segregation ATPase